MSAGNRAGMTLYQVKMSGHGVSLQPMIVEAMTPREAIELFKQQFDIKFDAVDVEDIAIRAEAVEVRKLGVGSESSDLAFAR